MVSWSYSGFLMVFSDNGSCLFFVFFSFETWIISSYFSFSIGMLCWTEGTVLNFFNLSWSHGEQRCCGLVLLWPHVTLGAYQKKGAPANVASSWICEITSLPKGFEIKWMMWSSAPYLPIWWSMDGVYLKYWALLPTCDQSEFINMHTFFWKDSFYIFT